MAINLMPYVFLLSVVDVLRFIAVFALALLSWVAYRRTGREVFAFSASGFSAIVIGIVLRYLAVVEANRNALCLGCLGFETFFAYYYASTMFMVIGAWLVAFAYVKRFSIISLLAAMVLALVAVWVAFLSFPAFAATLALIFGFIAVRTTMTAFRSRRAFWTAVSFTIIAVSFALESLVGYGAWFFPLGEVLGLVGFVMLATVLVRVWLR
ncbi:MAG: hypothetical protein ACMXYM_01815 [Candidatus Woesearchaeota archaeon]